MYFKYIFLLLYKIAYEYLRLHSIFKLFYVRTNILSYITYKLKTKRSNYFEFEILYHVLENYITKFIVG